VVLTKKSVHLDDTRDENEWREQQGHFPTFAHGSLSRWSRRGGPRAAVDRQREGWFLYDRTLSMAKSLAIPAAVAIQNARLYEWAAIYAAERKTLLKKISESPKTSEFDEESRLEDSRI